MCYAAIKRGDREMKYHELYNEYTSLLNDKAKCHRQLAVMKDGYISNKTISGKKYAYLQYRVNGKLLSKYIKDEQLPGVREELDTRENLFKSIRDIDERLKRIEKAADILDNGLSRKLNTLRRCAAMDTMSFEEREKSLAFGSAMTAIEGIPVSEEIEQNLYSWANGKISFLDSYQKTLQVYHLEEM